MNTNDHLWIKLLRTTILLYTETNVHSSNEPRPIYLSNSPGLRSYTSQQGQTFILRTRIRAKRVNQRVHTRAVNKMNFVSDLKSCRWGMSWAKLMFVFWRSFDEPYEAELLTVVKFLELKIVCFNLIQKKYFHKNNEESIQSHFVPFRISSFAIYSQLLLRIKHQRVSHWRMSKESEKIAKFAQQTPEIMSAREKTRELLGAEALARVYVLFAEVLSFTAS